jgi:hypothetical protein
MEWKPFKIKFGRERIITPGGLALVGQLLKHSNLARRLNQLGKPKGQKHRNSDCVMGLVGLLCQGKTDYYEDMREMQEDPSCDWTGLAENGYACLAEDCFQAAGQNRHQTPDLYRLSRGHPCPDNKFTARAAS